MADPTTELIKGLLSEATEKAEALQKRLEAGEEVSEEEMTAVARAIAEAIEEANEKLREMVGPIDSALLREKIVEDLTPEEFEEWSEDNAALMEYRAAKAKEGKNGSGLE